MDYTIYIYLTAMVFDLRLRGYDDDSPETEEILARMDAIWYRLSEDEHRELNGMCSVRTEPITYITGSVTTHEDGTIIYK